jgi:diguanylate cyclase (GGDEF)-like protein
MPDSLLLVLASVGAQALIAAALFAVLFWYAKTYRLPWLTLWAWAMAAMLLSLLGTGVGFALAFDARPASSYPRIVATLLSQFGMFLHLALVAIGSKQFLGERGLALSRARLWLIFGAAALLASVVTFSFISSERQLMYRLAARIGVHYTVSVVVFWLVVLRLSRIKSNASGVLLSSFFAAACLQSVILAIFVYQLHTQQPFGGRIFPFLDLLTLVSIAIGLIFWLLHLERGKVDDARSEVSRLSHFDPLTGIANQDYLMKLVDTALQKRADCALMVVDLDHFRSLGDALGRAQASGLIQGICLRIQRCVPQGAEFARLKHDSFAIFCTRVESAELEAIADQIHSALAPPFHVSDRQLYLTASIGIARYPNDAMDADKLLRAALLAVNQGKSLGRGQTRFYAAALNTAADARIGLLAELRQALNHDQFVLHYQPIFRLDGKLANFEALLRWQHPERGLLPPDQFINMLQPAAIHGAVDRLVLRRALKMLKSWRDRFALPLGMAVNIGANSFQSHDFIATVQRLLMEFDVPASALTLEITESTTLDDIDLALVVLTQLKNLGVCVSLDDFGTGYSSLSHLRRLPIGAIKIDRSFVHDIACDSKDAAIVTAIIQLSHKLGLSVVAEGVETAAQQTCLMEEQVDFLQGFLLGSPMSAEDVEAMLKRV